MSFAESVLVALFCFAMVFAVLISLYAMIRLFTFVLNRILSKNKTAQ